MVSLKNIKILTKGPNGNYLSIFLLIKVINNLEKDIFPA